MRAKLIDKVLAEFRAKNGRCVSELAEIMPMLMQVRLPDGHDFRVDEFKSTRRSNRLPARLDHENCRVKLDPRKSLAVGSGPHGVREFNIWNTLSRSTISSEGLRERFLGKEKGPRSRRPFP
mgnify:CR=1 FL=1